MHDPHLRSHDSLRHDAVRRDPASTPRPDRRPLLVAGVLAAALCGLIAFAGRDDDGTTVSASSGTDVATELTPTSPAPVIVGPTVTDAGAAGTGGVTPDTEVGDLDGDPETGISCTISERSLRQGQTGPSISCLQQALIAQGRLTGSPTGTFDGATFAAVEDLQTEQDLYVDGIVGRETALALGIWPDEQLLVVRTPPPPKGAKDLLGYPLSSVASAGDDAPALPPNSGAGRRLVYDRAQQRVWAIDDDGRIIRSWLVSGSKYNNELSGTHEVYSRSEVSTAWNGKAYLPKMVRWLKTDKGAIGFHSIPLHVEDKSPYQTEAELGQRLSGGCQRQAPADANFVWEWAQIGTKVVVL